MLKLIKYNVDVCKKTLRREWAFLKITIKNLNKKFGDTLVLKNINVTMNSGDFTTILGPSGCGKTTLKNHIWTWICR